MLDGHSKRVPVNSSVARWRPVMMSLKGESWDWCCSVSFSVTLTVDSSAPTAGLQITITDKTQ